MNVSPSAPRNRSLLAIYAGLVLLTLIAFWPVSRAEFISFDDPDYVTSNPVVQAGLTMEGFRWAFTTGHSGNWHPLTWLSHMLDWQLYGSKAPGHHLTNLLFHIANGVLLFLALRRMSRAAWQSAIVAALFAVHPLHVESVAWVSERKDVLSTFFGMLSLWFYIRHAEEKPGRGRNSHYWLSLLFFTCGLLSKPMLVTLPFIFLLLDFWPLQRMRKDKNRRQRLWPLFVEKLPFVALTLTSSIITFTVQQAGGAVRSVEEFSFWHRLANALMAYTSYLRKMVWPVDLAIFYPHAETLPTGLIVLSGLIVLAISAVALFTLRSKPYRFTGWFWFLGTLVPVIGLVQVGEQALADRYSYVPLIGIFIAITWWIGELTSQAKQIIPGFLAVISIGACAAATWRQAHVWQNNQTLFGHALKVTKRNYIAHNHLATDFIRSGNIGQAREHLVQAVAYRPRFPDALVNLGSIEAEEGNPARGKTLLLQAVEISPDFEEAHYNLANLYKTEGDFTSAAKHYQEVLRINASNGEAHSALGYLFANSGNMDAAIIHYTEAARLRPHDPAVHYNLGLAFLENGDVQAASGHLLRAVQHQSDFVPAHHQLGILFQRTGNTPEARKHLSTVTELDPSNEEARSLLEALGP